MDGFNECFAAGGIKHNFMRGAKISNANKYSKRKGREFAKQIRKPTILLFFYFDSSSQNGFASKVFAKVLSFIIHKNMEIREQKAACE